MNEQLSPSGRRIATCRQSIADKVTASSRLVLPAAVRVETVDDPSPLMPTTAEILIGVLLLAIILAVAVASYRRSRCLTSHPVWKSILMGAVAGIFWELWLILWYIDRERIADQWRAHRQAKQSALAS